MTTSVFELTSPRRPGLNDVGGGAKIDDSEFPPDPQTMVTADNFNQISLMIAAIGKVCPLAIIRVNFSGVGTGTAFIQAFACVNGTVDQTAFTVTHASLGVVSIQWASGVLPSLLGASVTLYGNLTGFEAPSADLSVANAVTVRTRTTGASSTNAAFTLVIY